MQARNGKRLKSLKCRRQAGQPPRLTSLTSADAPIDPFRARRILHWRFCEAFCCDMVLHATLDGDVV